MSVAFLRIYVIVRIEVLHSFSLTTRIMRFYEKFRRARFVRIYVLSMAVFLLLYSLASFVWWSDPFAWRLLAGGCLLCLVALVDLLNYAATLVECDQMADWGAVRMHFFLGLTPSYVRYVYANRDRIEREVKSLLLQPQYLSVRADFCHNIKRGDLVNAAAFLHFTRELERVRYTKRGDPDKIKRTAARIEKSLKNFDRIKPAPPRPPVFVDRDLENRRLEVRRFQRLLEDVQEEHRLDISTRVADLSLLIHRPRAYRMKAREIEKMLELVLPSSSVTAPVGLRRPRTVNQT